MESKEINLLHLAPRIPFPPDDGGKIGIFNTLRNFKKFNINNTFVFFSEDDLEIEHFKELQKYADVRVFKHSTKNSIPRIAKSFLLNKSIYIEKHSSHEFINFLKNLIIEKNINFAFADHTCMAFPLEKLKKQIGLNYAIKLNNIEWMIWKRYADEIPFYNPKKYYINQQSKALKKEEERLLKSTSVSFAITETDLHRAKELNQIINVKLVPSGVNLDEWQIDNTFTKNDNELIIATTYHWIHNVNALKWFIDNVMPILIKKNPKIKLTMLGKAMPEWMKNLDPKNYNPIGYVDSVQPYLNKASVYIAPLFVGSGVRIKILEALALGLPVVATDISAEGINANEKEGLFRANNPADFAKKILYLLENKENLKLTSINARKFIEEYHSWDIHTKIILDEMRKFI